MAAENRLTDAKVRSATRAKDGPYLRDGGALEVRLLEPSAKHPKGARLCEYHFKLKNGGDWKRGALHLGTYSEPFTDDKGVTRPFLLADARKARDAARVLVSRGIDPRETRRLVDAEQVDEQRKRLAALDGRRTVRQAFEKWHELYLAKHRRDRGDYAQGMFDRHILPIIGELPLDEWRRPHTADVIDARVVAGTDRTAKVVRSLMKQFATWCISREWIAGADPTHGITKKSAGAKDTPRQRSLSFGEIVELRDAMPAAAMPKRVEHALWLVLATGCRIGELSGASVAEFAIEGEGPTDERGTWHIPAERTKGAKAHDVPLSAFALQHVKALFALRAKSAWLLPSGRDDDLPISDKVISKMVRDRMRLVPLKGRSKASAALRLSKGEWTPHDLRRSAASRMRDLGVPSDVIEKCIGHAPASELVGVYQTSTLWAERVNAFDRWGSNLAALMTTDASSNVTTLSREAARGKVAA